MIIFHDVQLPINHVISKTVLHLVDVCITSHKQSKQMLKVYRKFSKNFKHLNFFSYFLLFKYEIMIRSFITRLSKW